jgi:hypothetical protein
MKISTADSTVASRKFMGIIMKKSRLFGAVCAIAICYLYSSSTQASTITFTHTGSGSGTIGGAGFTDANFVITAVGDTVNRIDVSNSSDPEVHVYSIVHDTASITIDGVGTASFLITTRTFYVTGPDDSVSSRGSGFGHAPSLDFHGTMFN